MGEMPEEKQGGETVGKVANANEAAAQTNEIFMGEEEHRVESAEGWEQLMANNGSNVDATKVKSEVEAEPNKATEDKVDTETEKSDKVKKAKGDGAPKALKVMTSLVAAVILVGVGVLAGAFMQRKSGSSAWENLPESWKEDGLVSSEGGVDLTVGMLMNQLQNKDKDKEDNKELEQVLDQLVDGSGGGKLVGNVALLSQNDKLTLELLKLHNLKENSCYSPLSIRYALEMLSEGAEGETKKQIDNLLGGVQATKYANVADHLSVANSLWMVGGIKESYQETLKNKYDAEVRQDDFKSAANINKWVEDKSFGMLKDAISDDTVRDLQAAIVNVLAIDMDWQNRFDENDTSGQYFNYDWNNESRNVKYTTMSRYGGEDIYYNLAAEATVLAQDLKEYGGTKLQFVAIMPNDLQSFVKNVNVMQINRLLLGLRKAVAQNDTYIFGFKAYIPKFSIESGIRNLIGDLKTMGVTDAFEGDADFSKITDDKFVIEEMVHKTKFDFSEYGIRAAAVTLAGGRGAGGDGPIPSSTNIVVSINKPFMYFVRDVKTGEIWFTGTVYQPNLWANDRAAYGKTSEWYD